MRDYPIFKTTQTRDAFLSIPMDEWVVAYEISANSQTIRDWVNGNFIERKLQRSGKARALWLRRLVDLPPEAMMVELRDTSECERERRTTDEPIRTYVTATPDHLAELKRHWQSMGSLRALCRR